MAKERSNVVSITRQSKPVDITEPYDAEWLRGKTIIITGGASGFGEAFFRKWAENGANVIIGDINDTRGKALVEEVRKQTGNPHLHYFHCDVTMWQSQVDLFHSALKVSPNGGIDHVVANAGVTDLHPTFETPQNLDAEEPPKPNFKCTEVNMIGAMYTAHLALFYLPRNPNSEAANSSRAPKANIPDRHLLLLGSVASLAPIPSQVQYAISKHGVLGMFRALRATSFTNGVRVNMLCPYFIDTPLIPISGRLILAGGATGKPEDVVDAGTRFMADSRIIGRALAIGPKIKVDDDWQLVPKNSNEGKEIAAWEVNAHDFDEVDIFTARFVRLINQVEIARGWVGFVFDTAKAFTYPLRRWWRG